MNPSDNPTLSIGQSRRTFLKAGLGAMAASLLFPGVRVRTAPRLQPEAPDAGGGFTRARGWGVALGAHEWFYGGDWVVDRTLELLTPDHWHSWGVWMSTRTEKRVPALSSDRWHDWEQGRQYLRDHSRCEWLAWNEPDMPRERTSPERAAELTMRFVDEARAIGNEFQICSPSVTLDTSSNGLSWLTDFMKIMRTKNSIFRFSSWNVHPYTCNTAARLRQSMAKWWEWYAVWGSGAPTIIGEICAEDASSAGQIAVMDEACAMLSRNEVLGVTWASAYQDREDGVPWPNYHLGILNHDTQTYELTDLGRRWKELQNGLRTTRS